MPIAQGTGRHERVPVLRVRGNRPAAVRRRAGGPACPLDTGPDHAYQFRQPLRVGRSEGRSAPAGRLFFDAFLYLANWGTRRLMFRLPAEVLGAAATAAVGQYLVGDCSTAWTADGFVVMDLLAEDEDGEYDEEWLDGSGLLASIVPVRGELMAVDFRLLYLA